jgi:hypothetical protein
VGDLVSKLKVLYKNVLKLTTTDCECYLVENPGENRELSKRLIIVCKDDTAITSVNFSRYALRHDSNFYDCVLLHNADYNGKVQTIVAIMTQHGFKYVTVDDKHKITDIEVFSANLCILTHGGINTDAYRMSRSFIFVYDTQNGVTSTRVLDDVLYNVITGFGEWCVGYRSDGLNYIVYFKDRDNIKKTKIGSEHLHELYHKKELRALNAKLDYLPSFCIVKGGENVNPYALLFDIAGAVKDEFKCWKLSRLMFNERITGVVRAYLIDDNLEKTGNFINILLIDDIGTEPKNAFRRCSVDDWYGFKEDVVYNTEWLDRSF